MTDQLPSDLPLVEVGRYARLSQARERALVVSAMALPHWIVRENRGFALRVEAPAQAAVALELERFELEQAQSAATRVTEKPLPKIETFSLYVVAWFLSASWLLQNLMPPWWLELGASSSRAVMGEGQWWRALTALTLHGDLSHFMANLASGLLFGAFVLPHLGAGFTWLAIVTSGFAGNLINAWFYQSTPHLSIGSSTAVFGALGLLVGGEFYARLSTAATRSRWQLVLPLGAGLALLAFLGAGDEPHQQTDYMAHLWGFMAGLALGMLAAALHLRERGTGYWQTVAAWMAPLLIILAWWRAFLMS